MQFLDYRVKFLYPNLLSYMGEILLQFWNLKKNILVFFQSYGSTLCPEKSEPPNILQYHE